MCKNTHFLHMKTENVSKKALFLLALLIPNYNVKYKYTMKSKVLALILLCGAASLGAKVKLPALVGDNMILQQQTEVKLWGTAAPEAEVRVTPSWNGQTMTCRADKDGGWTLAVETPAAGYTPYEITFDERRKTTLKNILIGEVWLASGQSNMEMPLKGFAWLLHHERSG